MSANKSLGKACHGSSTQRIAESLSNLDPNSPRKGYRVVVPETDHHRALETETTTPKGTASSRGKRRIKEETPRPPTSKRVKLESGQASNASRRAPAPSRKRKLESETSSQDLDDESRPGPSTRRRTLLVGSTNGRGTPWTTQEYELLAQLYAKHGKTKGAWPLIYTEWYEHLADDGIHERSKASLTSARTSEPYCLYHGITPEVKPKVEKPQDTAQPPVATTVGPVLPNSPTPPGPPAPPGPPEPPGPSQPGPSNQARPEDEESFRKLFAYHYRKALQPFVIRPALRKPIGEIKEHYIQWGDACLTGVLTKDTNRCRLMVLNAGTYAVGKAITSLCNRRANENRKEAKLFQKKNQDRLAILKEELGILENEVIRRANDGLPGCETLERVRTICKSYHLDHHRGMLATQRRIKDEMETLEQRLEQDKHDLERVRARKAGFRSTEPRMEGDIPVKETRDYWAKIIGNEKPFQPTPAMDSWRSSLANVRNEDFAPALTNDDWDSIFKKGKPWKAPGPDGIPFWYFKRIPAARMALVQWCNQALRDPCKPIPSWFSKGRTVVIPKDPIRRDDPSLYRPITCLNTSYKVFTAVLANRIELTAREYLPASQVAMAKKVWGCSQAHIMDQTITADAAYNRRNLHMLWVDMKKAYDSVSHRSIKWVLGAMGVPGNIRSILKRLMLQYETRFVGKQNGKFVTSDPLSIKCGIMQGDTLSPLLFCCALIPLSNFLESSIQPYKVKDDTKLGHLFYMDDLKVYTSSSSELEKATHGIIREAGALGLELNPAKCATCHLNRGVNTQGQGATDNWGIPVLGIDQMYKYLGIQQNAGPVQKTIQESITDKCLNTCRKALKSQLTIRQKVDMINMCAIPKFIYGIAHMIYSRGKLESTRKLARELDNAVRALCVEEHLREANAAVARYYLPKTEGGLGLRRFEDAFENAIVYSACYLSTKADLKPYLHCAEAQQGKGKRTIVSDLVTIACHYDDISLEISHTIPGMEINSQVYLDPTKAARAIVKQMDKERNAAQLRDFTAKAAASKVFTDTIPRGMFSQKLDLKESAMWSSKGHISNQVLRLAWGVQEGTVYTKASPRRPFGADRKCRVCTAPQETGIHIVSCCPHWRNTLMIERHNAVAKVLHLALSDKYGFTYNQRKAVPEVLENEQVTLYWDTPIRVTTQLKHVRPDIIIWDKQTKHITIAEFAVSKYDTIPQMEERKYKKYAVNSTLPEETPVEDYTPGPNLAKALHQDKKCQVRVMPFVIGAIGECTHLPRQQLTDLGLSSRADQIMERMQRAAVLGSHRIIKSHLAIPE